MFCSVTPFAFCLPPSKQFTFQHALQFHPFLRMRNKACVNGYNSAFTPAPPFFDLEKYAMILREEETIFICLLLWRRRKGKSRRQRGMRAHPIFQLRKQQGKFHNLVQEMKMVDCHFRYLSMSKECFDGLLSEVSCI